METNISKITKPFENKWVALSGDFKKVVSNGNTLKEVMAKVKKEEKNKVVFYKVIPAYYEPFVL